MSDEELQASRARRNIEVAPLRVAVDHFAAGIGRGERETRRPAAMAAPPAIAEPRLPSQRP